MSARAAMRSAILAVAQRIDVATISPKDADLFLDAALSALTIELTKQPGLGMAALFIEKLREGEI